jgi:hypothetical protein
MRGEWGKGKTPFPLIKRVVRVKGGYTQSFGGPLALFLIFHEFMSKGGACRKSRSYQQDFLVCL